MNTALAGRQAGPFLRLLATLSFVFACLAAASPDTLSAQATGLVDDTTFVSSTGKTITWSSPWVIDQGSLITGGGVDLVFLTNRDYTVVIGTGDFEPEQGRGLVLGYLGGNTDMVTTIDAGTTGATAYWLDRLPLRKTDYGSFTLAEITTVGAVQQATMTMVIAPVGTFADAVQQAQAAIAIDAVFILPGVGGDGLQSTLAAVAQPAAPSPTSTEAGTAFVPAGTWTDPIYGFTVEWASGWTNAGQRNENTLTLVNASIGVSVNLTAMPSNGMTPQQCGDWLSTPPVAFPDWTSDPPIINARNVIVVGRTGGMTIINEAMLIDYQTTVLVTLGTANPDLAAAVRDYQSSVRIAGRAPLEGWQPASGSALQPPAAPNTPYGDVGMVSPQHYASPQFGVEVQWDDSWQLDPMTDVPVVSDPGTGTDTLFLALVSNDAVALGINIGAWPGIPMDQFMDMAAAEQNVTDIYGPNATLIMSTHEGDRGAIVVRVPNGIVPIIVYEEFYLLNNSTTLVEVRFSAPAIMVETGVPAVQQHVTLFGQPFLNSFPMQDLLIACTS